MRDGRRDNDGGASTGRIRETERDGEERRMMLFALIVFNFVRVNSNRTTWLNFFFLFCYEEIVIWPLAAADAPGLH